MKHFKEFLLGKAQPKLPSPANPTALGVSHEGIMGLIAAEQQLVAKINRSVSLDEGLRLCLDTAIQVSGMSAGSIHLVNGGSGPLGMACHVSIPDSFATNPEPPSTYAEIMRSGVSVYTTYSALNAGAGTAQDTASFMAMAVIPIHHEGKPVACLSVASSTLETIPESARTLLDTVAASIGGIIVLLNAEDALRKNDWRHRSLSNAMQQAVIETDRAGKVTFANPALCTVFGYTQEDVAGGMSVFDMLMPDDIPRVKRLISDIATGAESGPSSFMAKKKDGTGIPIMIAASPIMSEGRYQGFRCIVFDITESKRKEEEAQKRDKLEAIGRLAGGVAHDFNNLLTIINGNVDYLRDTLTPAATAAGDTVEVLDEITKAIFRAAALTKQLLTFSKGGAPVMVPIDLRTVVRDTASFACSRTSTLIVYTFPDDLWLVNADTGQISQVVQNLAVNASQAMPDGGILTISAKNIILDKDNASEMACGNYVEATFSDTGHGMPEEVMAKIFDPYFTTKSTGNGLGLSTSYSIIQKHGGRLSVRSTEGVGTTFTILLRASKEAPKVMSSQIPGAIRGHGSILVLDDEDLVRASCGRVLRRLGYTTTEVSTVAEAIGAYRAAWDSGAPFTAVICDLRLPSGSGVEALEGIRAINPKAKVIASSGYADNQHPEGFDAELPKPYSGVELSNVLNCVINSGNS